MNDASNGSIPGRDLSVRAAVAAALFGGFAVTMGGCPGPAPSTGGNVGGSGGETTTSSSSSSSTSSSSSSSSSSSTGGMPCTADKECMEADTVCKTPACVNGACTFVKAEAQKPCDEDGGKVCDGSGHCVECITVKECADPCDKNTFTPTECKEGKCKTDAPVNCTTKGKLCTEGGCGPCTQDNQCPVVTVSECFEPKCNILNGTCGEAPVLHGGPCATSAGVCDPNHTCVQAKLVFVTSQQWMGGEVGGIDDADTKCQVAADNAGLGGMWSSWTSTLASKAKGRLMGNTSLPYWKLNGMKVANSLDELTDPMKPLASPIDIDENKMPVLTAQEVWTGTNGDGSPSGTDCNGWMSSANPVKGTTGKTIGFMNGQWTSHATPPCDTKGRLYCFQK